MIETLLQLGNQGGLHRTQNYPNPRKEGGGTLEIDLQVQIALFSLKKPITKMTTMLTQICNANQPGMFICIVTICWPLNAS